MKIESWVPQAMNNPMPPKFGRIDALQKNNICAFSPSYVWIFLIVGLTYNDYIYSKRSEIICRQRIHVRHERVHLFLWGDKFKRFFLGFEGSSLSPQRGFSTRGIRWWCQIAIIPSRLGVLSVERSVDHRFHVTTGDKRNAEPAFLLVLIRRFLWS